ncbi:MAG: exodeoxyribonuclease V subunit gamma [Lachnospiraceae bacterium]|nr:exodeoxyribonuclease V subunit gamma [Lachnospiraceae bacterium]
MSLQLILGGSGAGKSHYLFRKIIEDSVKYPEKRFLVIVPEQFTMQTQKELVTRHPDGGILNIDVLSFERLAYRIFEEVGVDTGSMLEEIGKSFVLQKIALDRQKELPFLGKNLAKPGYIYEMKSLISELKQYDIGIEVLDDMIKQAGKRPQLNGKLKDIRTICRAFSEYVRDKYMTAEDVLGILCDLVDRSLLLKNSVLAFDGFTGFTPVQNKLLRRLLKLSEQIYVTITIDAKEDVYVKPKEQELFAMSKKMAWTLCNMASDAGVAILPEVRLEHNRNSRFRQAPALAFLEQNLFRYRSEKFEQEQQEIQICMHKNPLREVQAAATAIRRLVRREGYRYREIAIVTGDLKLYGNYVRQICGTEGIPYFIDEKRCVLNNPYIEFLRGAMAVEAENYSYNSVFRYLRSGMSDVSAEKVNRLENYVLALGIRGFRKWNEKWIRHYDGIKPDEVEELDQFRQEVMAELRPFHEAIRGGADSGKSEDVPTAREKTDAEPSGKNPSVRPTVRQLTKAIYELGRSRNAQEKLKEKENAFAMKKRPDLVREYAQVYGKVMSFLDKLVDVLGDESVSFSDYQTILEAGFLETKIGIIPPSTDQVLVGDIERTRLKDVKVLFFLGVNDGLIPKGASGGGILSEADREFLESEAFELKPSPRESMYIQKFYLYLNLTKPSRKLILSFSGSDSRGEVAGPAYLIGSVRKLFPNLSVEEESEELEELVETPESGMEYLIEGLRKNAETEPSPEWKELYRWYASNKQYAGRLYALVNAAFKTCPKDRIGRAVAKALYGNVLENSATRLERFAACAFAHFLQYGLLLKERQQYEFTGMDMGNLVHAALESFSGKVAESPFGWHGMGDDLRETLIRECVEEVIHDYGNTILHSSARNEYMIARVQRIMSRTVWALQEQIRRSDFVPERFEVSFRMEENLKSVNVDLSEAEKMKIRGRIDRLDTYDDGKNIYVKVIDYKSGSTGFDLVAVYYGLQLQLVLYMNAALEYMNHRGKDAQPAGIFYYNVKDPVEEWKDKETEEELRERILNDLKLNGLVQADRNIIEHLDRTLRKKSDEPNTLNENIDEKSKMDARTGKKSGSAGDEVRESKVIPVKYNKNGSLSANSSVANAEQFAALSVYAANTVRGIGREILDGNVTVNPYERKGRSSCDYCSYRNICGFDSRIPGYEFRQLDSLKKEEIWQLMKEKNRDGENAWNDKNLWARAEKEDTEYISVKTGSKEDGGKGKEENNHGDELDK